MTMKVWDKNGQPCGTEELATPAGKRIPDGILWAYEASDFYRESSSDAVWSRSMIEEFGGRCPDDDDGLVNPEPSPCRLIPWLSRLSISCDGNGTLMTRACDELGLPSVESRKDVQNAPLLREFITTDHLPEILLINDPYNYTGSARRATTDSCKKFIARYVRAIPPISHKELVPLAKIDMLSASPIARVDFTAHLGDGNHSSVYRAALRLLWVDHGVSVAVKIASGDVGASRMLAHEARIYASLPEHLMDDWSGFHYLEETQHNGNGVVPVHAVVPKFYGCYFPVVTHKHGSSTRNLKPLLLVEDCGQPVVPSSLMCAQRQECSSLVARLHRAGYVHNSLYARNILMQPGPLSQPPSLRSVDSPSFRVIDFGRTERYDGYQSRKAGAGIDAGEINKQWQRNMCNELLVAKELFRTP